MIDKDDPVAKELIYSMKMNFWMHDDPRKIRVSRVRPMYKGTREEVFTRAKRPILEMWIEDSALTDDIESETLGLGEQVPILARTGRGQTATHRSLVAENLSSQVTMFHIDVGRVYVWP